MSDEGERSSAAACPLCSGLNPAPTFVRDGYAFLECRRCRTLFSLVVPGQDALTRLYREASSDRGSTLCWDVESRHDVSSFTRALEVASRSTGRGPILDIGCGTGPFLVCAREQGWSDLTGLEVSPRAAAAARTASGAEVRETPLDEADLPHDHYALVGLWDVLEHLPAAGRALERIRQLLRPGGIIAVSTPNRFGLAVLIFGRRSVVVCPPEHLLIASRRGLQSALNAAGLCVDGMWSEDLRVREWTRWFGASKPAGVQRQNYRDIQGRLTRSTWFATARSMANVVLRTTRIGDQLLAVASRPRA